MANTYADIASKLHRKKSKWEKNLKNTDPTVVNTAKRMISRIDGKLEELFQRQEASKQDQAPTREMGGGGLVIDPDGVKKASTMHSPLLTSLGAAADSELWDKIGGSKPVQDFKNWLDDPINWDQNMKDEKSGVTREVYPTTPLGPERMEPLNAYNTMPGNSGILDKFMNTELDLSVQDIPASKYSPNSSKPKSNIIPANNSGISTKIPPKGVVMDLGLDEKESATRKNAEGLLNDTKVDVEIPSTVSEESGYYEPPVDKDSPLSFLNNMGKDKKQDIIKGAGVLAKYFNRQGAINNQKKPEAPVYAPRVNMDSSLDTSNQESTIRRNKLLMQKAADNLGSQSASWAAKSRAAQNQVAQLSKLGDQKTNYKTQVDNREASINASIGTRNAYAANRHREDLNTFLNDKGMAKSKNFESLLNAFDTYRREKAMKKHDLLRLDIASKGYNSKVMEELYNKIPELKKLLKNE